MSDPVSFLWHFFTRHCTQFRWVPGDLGIPVKLWCDEHRNHAGNCRAVDYWGGHREWKVSR